MFRIKVEKEREGEEGRKRTHRVSGESNNLCKGENGVGYTTSASPRANASGTQRKYTRLSDLSRGDTTGDMGSVTGRAKSEKARAFVFEADSHFQ